MRRPGPELRRLAEPPPPSLVETVRKGGRDSAYLAHYHVQQILLRLLGAYDWTIESVGFHEQTGTIARTRQRDGKEEEYEIPVYACGQEEPAWCVGTLSTTVDGDPVRVSGTGTGRDIKSAESDALKRAASKIGVGLSLWAKGGRDYWLPKQWAADDREEGGETT